MTVQAGLDSADLAVVWSRLVTISDEIWMTIRKTAFSPIISTALDFGCGLLCADGSQLAMGAVGMASFNLALPSLARDLLYRHGPTLQPGDVFIGNDPWLCIGHLDDVAIITPVFADSRLVAFIGSIAHQADIGGAYARKRVREVHEEGLFLPMSRLYAHGEPDPTLFDLLRANVRQSHMVLGDLEAQVAANEVGARRLLALMDEYHLADVADLSAEIQGRSERAMREVIRGLPNGTYRSGGLVDGVEAPVHIALELRVDGDQIFVDYTEAPPQFEFGGQNATLSYTVVNTHYILECILAPHLPHNEGSIRPLHVTAPAGSVLNCTFPAAVGQRHVFTTRVSSLVLGALAQAAPDLAMAGYGTNQGAQVMGRDEQGEYFQITAFSGGGRGGALRRDGIGGFIYTSGAASVPTEFLEQAAPVLFLEKEWDVDSGGPGAYRGGPGQRISFRRLPGYKRPVDVRFSPSRARVGAPGFLGGRAGSLSDAEWNGRPVEMDPGFARDGILTLNADSDVFTYHVPSGGGYGDPRQREPEAVERDVAMGLVSAEGAVRDYACAVRAFSAEPPGPGERGQLK
jgi:N-methylhydantoinase B/oxoprolinase/acetone carboxylase alpha subunit